ncbi:myotubularin-related protein 10-B-like [Saccoglossus kowalevskii]
MTTNSASKSTFTSYVDLKKDAPEAIESSGERRGTFKSYINWSYGSKKRTDIAAVSKAAEDVFEQKLEPKLLSGEIIIAQAHHVLKYNTFGDLKHGVSGSLYCTNFKISFVTAERSSYDMMELGQRNILVSENDIPLTCVDAVHQGNELHESCFTFASSPFIIVNTILHHAFPTKLPLLFAFSFKPKQHVEENGHDAPIAKVIAEPTLHFRDCTDWERELIRVGAQRFRVTMSNQDFKISDSLPEYFVVPSCLTDNDVTQASHHFVDGRVLTWSWTHKNGSSLYRMVPLRMDTTQDHHEQRMLAAVKESHPKKLPSVWIDVEKSCPTIAYLQSSYLKLKDLCVPESMKSFMNIDDKWYSQVDSTRWLHYTRKCLQTAIKTASALRNQGKSVIIKESEGRDFSCLVSSLVQIILDPHYRTQRGFQGLIQREWVVMGHPFLDRYQHVTLTEGEESPVFLLFLACVWQLMNQFPSSFSFTDTYLITLWDCSLHGLFETFIFNSERQRYRAFMTDHKTHAQLVSVWDWSLQFKEEDIALFNNPLYCVHHGQHLNCPGCNTNDVRTFDLKLDHVNENANEGIPAEKKSPYRKLSQCNKMTEENSSSQRKISVSGVSRKNDVLIPEVSAPNIIFWTQCYLRWVPSVHIVGGGPPSEYLQQCMVADEIHQLRMKIHSLQTSTPLTKTSGRDSGLYFSFDTPAKMVENFTSAFPFSPRTSRLSSMLGDGTSWFSSSGLFFRSSSVSSYDGILKASGSMSSTNTNDDIDEAGEM